MAFKTIAKIEEQQDPFNVGQKIWVVVDGCVIDAEVSSVDNYARDVLKKDGTWIECPDNIGQTGRVYYYSLSKFIAKQPHASWTKDSEGVWNAPIAKPTNPLVEVDSAVDEDNPVSVKVNIERYKISWDEDNQRWMGRDFTDNTDHVWDPATSTWN